ncbi:MAG: cryptochrome/photolyase family protein, partial [Thermostichales cyanobacterium HHBFW_bins_127]
MTLGVWILGDQLHPHHPALPPPPTPILMVESHHWVEQRNYHQQKLVLVWSAMRHRAAELQQQGYRVTYQEAPNFRDPLLEWIGQEGITHVHLMTPADIPFRQHLQALWPGIPAELVWVENNQFLWSADEFSHWARGRKRLLMEDFYRLGRKKYQILMDGDQPVGGRWNFDADNRKTPPPGATFPPPLTFPPDAITRQVMEKVRRQYGHHYGNLDSFGWAVTRTQAQIVLQDFVEQRLAHFGPYEDAMLTHHATLWHSRLSPYLNLGLLSPQEVLQAALQQHQRQPLPLPSLEGFIRQILGWREYIRGLYEYLMPDGYAQRNHFGHQRPLPDWFWTGETDLFCLRTVLYQIYQTGYAHHIQRLMILSNFALISGIHPAAV